MYESIKQIQSLKKSKQDVLSRVYQSNNPDDVYKNQRILGSMTISIFSDVSNVVMPALHKDGVNNLVWSNISLRLTKLSFTSIPTTFEIREKYKKSIENPTIVKIHGPTPEPGVKTKAKVELPAFLVLLASTGIAVPLVLNIFGVPKWALVLVDTVLMTIEVVAYFSLRSKKRKKSLFIPAKESANYDVPVNYKDIYIKAIQEVYVKNSKKLDEWFDTLEKITIEEIDKALEEMKGQ